MIPDRLYTKPFVLAFAANFFSGLAFALFLHLPGYLTDLGADETQIGVIFGLTAVASIAMRPFLGTAMDRYGRRPVILVGNIINITFILFYLTVSVLGPWVYVVRIGHGVAEAMLFSALFTYGTDVVPSSRRTEGLAMFGVSGLLPIAFAGIIGDIVLAVAGFRELFMLAAFFAFLTLAFSLPLPERKPAQQPGVVRRGFWAIARNRELLPIWWMIGMFSFALTAYFVFLRTYVDETGIGSVGLFFAVYAAVAIIERIFFGRVPQRFGEHRTLYVALIMFAAGFVVLGTTSSTAGVALAGAMCGAGHGYAFPILTSMTVTRAPDADRGSAIAFFTSLFDVGLLVGGPILGAIIGARGYPAMFLFAGFAVFAGVLIFAVWDRSVMRPHAGVTSG